MKIFFTAAVQGKNDNNSIYEYAVTKMKNLGHKVIDAELLLETSVDQLNTWSGSQDLLEFHKRVIEDIKHCDVFVADVTHQRVSTGYWISLALDMGKPTIALCKKGGSNHLLETLEIIQKFTLYNYNTKEDLGKELPLLLDFAAEQQDTRFNFFISPKHQNYLDWIARYRKIPRSVYLRQLIEQDMANNPEFFESELSVAKRHGHQD
ncbi:MAG TPA: hypothetical protein DEP87_02510 [Candidatus Pacebacteria bacterium]|nr:hypothetical protein [Candidatus Paceibacterota bacterium]